MTNAVAHTAQHSAPAFRHAALLYRGPDEFLAGTVPFILEAVGDGVPTLVVVSAAKIDLLRRELGRQAERVAFADMHEVGVNPARLIPLWQDFVDHESQRCGRVTGIGEPVWPERSDDELIECQRHEALLNLAFAGGAPLSLLCPYDTQTLAAAVLDEARCSHAVVIDERGEQVSERSRSLEEIAVPCAAPLSEPTARVRDLGFDIDSLALMRVMVSGLAADAGLSKQRTADLVLAINELATNSIRHGGGRGRLRAWLEDDRVVCEVHDQGRLDEPLVGRRRPGSDETGGHGLWLVNQLCELVQVRAFAHGNVVRVHLLRR